jgi:hypothetical protein
MLKQLRNKKNAREKFGRRKISLFNKADDFHRIFGADVYFVIQKKGRYYTYTSADKLHWPPTKEQIVGLLLLYSAYSMTNKHPGTELPSIRNKVTSGL